MNMPALISYICNCKSLNSTVCVKMSSHSVYVGNHHKLANSSTFVKLNKKRGAAKGLGHSTTNKNNFDRRSSVTTTHSSPEKASAYTGGECERSLSQQSRSQSHSHHEICNGFRGQFEFTEQRCNYERISQQQQQRQRQFLQYDRHTWPSELISNSQIFSSRITNCTSDQVEGDAAATMLLDFKAVNSQFLALHEFRNKNSNECYGNGRHIEFPLQLPDNFIHTQCHYSVDTPTSPMPYALRQSLLRAEMAKDFTNRVARKEFIKSGLNKSLALSYQPMYGN